MSAVGRQWRDVYYLRSFRGVGLRVPPCLLAGARVGDTRCILSRLQKARELGRVLELVNHIPQLLRSSFE